MTEDPIDPDDFTATKRKRRIGTVLFLALYIIVSAILISIFYVFTRNLWLAVILVGFMTTYMAFMGWAAMRRPEDKDV